MAAYYPERRNFYHVVLYGDEVVGTSKTGSTKRKITFHEPGTGVDHVAFGYGNSLYIGSTSGGIHANGTQYVDIIKDGRGTVIAIRKSEDKT